MLHGLDLFSGIGGITLGLAEWVRPVAYCECDRYAQGDLLSRMHEGVLPIAPIWDDVRTLEGSLLYTRPDIVYGGFPCQGFSLAGNKKGLGDERSGLFWEIPRLTSELRPDLVFLENVPAITSNGGAIVLGAFTELGYDTRWCVISARSVGARHIRKRWFLLAHANSARKLQPQGVEQLERKWVGNSGENVAYPSSERLQANRQRERKLQGIFAEPTGSSWWHVEPNVGRVAHGIPCRVDRIKCSGNAVVPQQVRKAFEILSGLNVNFHEA